MSRRLAPIALQSLQVLSGKLVATGLRPGWTIREEFGGLSLTAGTFRYQRQREVASAVDARTGEFTLPAMEARPHALVLCIPATHPNCLPMRLPLGSFAPRPGRIEIAGGDLRLATVRGKLAGAMPEGAAAALRVVALVTPAGRFGRPRPIDAADVAADGSFVLTLPAGRYPLIVQDVVTSLPVGRLDPLEVEAGAEMRVQIPIALRAVTIELPPAEGDASRQLVGLRIEALPRDESGALVEMSFNRICLSRGERRLQLALPKGSYQVIASSLADPAVVTQQFEVGDEAVTVPLPK